MASRKRLPDVGRRERTWGFVEKVAPLQGLEDHLKGEVYETKTRGMQCRLNMSIAPKVDGHLHFSSALGTRILEPMRPCGEGVYHILDHEGHTHLVYVLAMPEKPGIQRTACPYRSKPSLNLHVGEVQQTFNITPQASYILSIKNPSAPSPPWAGLSERSKADLPPAYEALFKDRRFIPANPVELLNFDHVEFLLIGAREDVGGEAGQGEGLSFSL